MSVQFFVNCVVIGGDGRAYCFDVQDNLYVAREGMFDRDAFSKKDLGKSRHLYRDFWEHFASTGNAPVRVAADAAVRGGTVISGTLPDAYK